MNVQVTARMTEQDAKRIARSIIPQLQSRAFEAEAKRAGCQA